MLQRARKRTTKRTILTAAAATAPTPSVPVTAPGSKPWRQNPKKSVKRTFLKRGSRPGQSAPQIFRIKNVLLRLRKSPVLTGALAGRDLQLGQDKISERSQNPQVSKATRTPCSRNYFCQSCTHGCTRSRSNPPASTASIPTDPHDYQARIKWDLTDFRAWAPLSRLIVLKSAKLKDFPIFA